MAIFSYRCKDKSIGRKEKGHFIQINTGYQCKSGLSEVYLSSGVYEAMYKSRLCIEMRFLPRFSDQVFRNRVDNRLYQRDLYKGAPFCR